MRTKQVYYSSLIFSLSATYLPGSRPISNSTFLAGKPDGPPIADAVLPCKGPLREFRRFRNYRLTDLLI
jgi:hypothetical protein